MRCREEKRRKNGCLSASLGNFLLTRANEETSFDTINSCVNSQL